MEFLLADAQAALSRMALGESALDLLPYSTPGANVWFWVTLLIGLIWLRRHGDLNRAARDPVLRPGGARTPADAPRMSVLVAGKDEEANVERCLRGLAAQDYPNLEILFINDRSTDRTGEIADRLATEPGSRLRVMHVRELPAGWFGKNNAMRMGVEQARGDWLLFSDADCSYDSTQLVSAALQYAKQEGVEFVSVMPLLEATSFWERVVQPVAAGVMVFWFPPQKVNDLRFRQAYANGAFMLLSRAAYERLGGHEAVRQTLNEDMHLARLAKAQGMPIRVIRADGMLRVRMYTGLAPIWRGWTRIFYGCLRSFGKLLGSVAFLSLVSLSPYVTLLAGAATSAASGFNAGWPLMSAGLMAIACQQSVLWRFYPLSGVPAAWALTYPLGSAICLGATLNAMRRLAGAPTTWRGTRYARGA